MNKREELLAKIMNFLAEKYKNQLILKGGMLLRLFNSPRETMDLDYAWIRTKKRNLFADDIESSLKALDFVKVSKVTVNSRGIFIDLKDPISDEPAKLEINVVDALHCPPTPLTTSALSRPYSLKPQIVSTMNLAEALSNKIAATLERDQIRDPYDLMQMEPLTPFDEKTLRDRLSHIEIGRLKLRSISTAEAANLLKEKMNAITKERLYELAAIIPGQSLEGMDLMIKASMARIVQKIEFLDHP